MPELQQEIIRRTRDLFDGLHVYQATRYEREQDEPPVIWEKGSARLLDYGQWASLPEDAPCILFIPSLINRYYILDLAPERSMVRWLVSQGIRPLILDWGEPTEAERTFDCGDYITNYLYDAFEFLSADARGELFVAGYCMGGLLALALAQKYQEEITGLVLLATPWDFHSEDFCKIELNESSLEIVEQFIDGQTTMPYEVVQGLFYTIDPWSFHEKFRDLAKCQPGSEHARAFKEFEHWVNDGVDLAAPVARQCFIEWVYENAPYRGQFKVEGRAVDPRMLGLPTMVALPQNDTVVPPYSAAPLQRLIPQSEVVRPQAGHVGMIIGHRARELMWEPLAQWVREF